VKLAAEVGVALGGAPYGRDRKRCHDDEASGESAHLRSPLISGVEYRPGNRIAGLAVARVSENPSFRRRLVGHRRGFGDNPYVSAVAWVELVGRERELARVSGWLDDVPLGPCAAVVRGDAGIGKTVLWRAALEAAQARGFTVLSTRCVEAEMPLAFGGLADLLDAVLAEIAHELAEPQRAALAIAVGLEAPGDEPPDQFVLSRAFAAALRLLGRDAPVLLAVDDVQWLDPPSRRLLAFAARRLGDAPVGILITQRGDAHDPLDLAHALEHRMEEICLGPLSLGALHHLVRSRLGVRISRPMLARVHAASGGNPMFALEFARGVATHAGGSPGLLPVPSSLEELVRERVAGYPEEIRPLLMVVAAVQRPRPSLLARTIEGADSLLDAAIAAGAVTLGDDAVVRFSHPLLASAVYADVPPTRRRALHARVAALTDDLEERARHLALAAVDPDANVAGLLDEAAARARARGAPDAAAGLAEQALRLTPPQDVGAREDRALALGAYLADAGQIAAAAASLDEFLAGGVSGPPRAQALLIRFDVEHDIEARARVAEEALAHAGDDRALRARVLIAASQSQANREAFAASEALAREALAEAEQVDDPALLATALAAVALRTVLPEPELLERAIALADVHGTLPRSRSPRVVLAELHLASGDVAGAREILEAELDAMRRRGREFERPRTSLNLAVLETAVGKWERAEQHLDEAWELAFDGGDRHWEALVRYQRGALASLRGDIDEARQLARLGMAHGEAHWPLFAAWNRWVLGRLELSLGQPEGAWQLLADVVEPDLWGDELELLQVIPDALEALVTLGRLDEAEAILIRFEAQFPEHLWAIPAVLRCRALVLLARGEAERAAAAGEQSAVGFEAAGFPFDRGRALLVAGEALRRAGDRRRAAEKLEAAKEIFAGLGARVWLERTEQELRRASPRPRSDRELTSAERRVASLVATGRTNREVAARLFTTVGTVEVHLTRIYRKLGLRSRTELARRVADGTLDLADE
jgi:DNA-binding NarL/FixJ family response regulator